LFQTKLKKIYCTSDSICQSELYCKLHSTHFHYP